MSVIKKSSLEKRTAHRTKRNPNPTQQVDLTKKFWNGLLFHPWQSAANNTLVTKRRYSQQAIYYSIV